MQEIDVFVAALFAASLAAGLLGSIAGLGGGVLLVPLLTVGFGLPIRLAIGASIVSVIATSSAAGAAYVTDHLTNVRLAMLLEVATSVGAVTGALIAPWLPTRLLFIVFGLLLAGSLVPTVARLGEEDPRDVAPDRLARRWRLSSAYPDRARGRVIPYAVTGVPLGFGLMYVAGVASGLLGIGSGALKVLALDTVMRLPIKVSSATSNFMIGVTAAASAGIYFWRGDVVPVIAAPVALGILIGATVGSRLLTRVHGQVVRRVFTVALAVVAVEMLLRGIRGP
ncbi:MAG: sulfite exporter TauE/SafE family protein [Thermomicrobiales bacterium]|nr:sulfite exporter TauE/SafE family protein [Thermomicrobiales bacterium]